MKPNIKPSHSRAIARPALPTGRYLHGSRAAIHDPRWPQIARVLAGLREDGRHAVRIVDSDCGAGCLLLYALHHARALGFTAIEGRGIDGSPALIGRARAAAGRARDIAICAEFEVADVISALREEQDFPADIALWHGSRSGDQQWQVLLALRAAGNVIIGDSACVRSQSMAS